MRVNAAQVRPLLISERAQQQKSTNNFGVGLFTALRLPDIRPARKL